MKKGDVVVFELDGQDQKGIALERADPEKYPELWKILSGSWDEGASILYRMTDELKATEMNVFDLIKEQRT